MCTQVLILHNPAVFLLFAESPSYVLEEVIKSLKDGASSEVAVCMELFLYKRNKKEMKRERNMGYNI